MLAKYEEISRRLFLSAVADSIRIFFGQGLGCGRDRVNEIGFFVSFGVGGCFGV